MAQIKIEFGFGTSLGKDGSHLSFRTMRDGLETVTQCALRLFGGYTIYSTQGGWKDLSDGRVFVEQGATVVVFVDMETAAQHDEGILNLVAVIKSALNQRAVYVVKTKVECDLM